ncbi:MAG: ribosomal protein L7/L12 [Candidatus Shikimatogenerans sp. JK-2022]|nr:ribosomal protein L7/L12 [Candidatus Shikimatogenerans bostrichidophilus]
MIDLKKIAKNLVELNLKDINKLSLILEEKYGIKEKNIIENTNNKDQYIHNLPKENDTNTIKKNIEDVKSLYDLYLNSIGSIKLPIIKLISNITGKSLTESKKMIDNLPIIIKKDVDLEEGKKIQEDFKKIEGIIELK